MNDEHIFKRETVPLIQNYITDPVYSSQSRDLLFDAVFIDTKKRRESNVHLESILHAIGKSQRLYDALVQCCRVLFKSTKNPVFCTLRNELLMSFHDRGLMDVRTTHILADPSPLTLLTYSLLKIALSKRWMLQLCLVYGQLHSRS